MAEPAVPRLRQLVKDLKSTQRTEAAMSLWQLKKDVRLILPNMIEHIQGGDQEWEAADVLAAMGPDAAPAVPALTEMLQGDETAQLAAARALGSIGPAAKSSLPSLRHLVEFGDPEVRPVVQEAIDKIEQ